ncbi:MAG: hypothetical protein ACRCYC_04075 [Paraclostridium sp.]|uniref:hypothetical protein n=1 Tax=Paraclostridium sp. TaxID=2023273 RepID=UPI003F2D02BE
MFKRKKKKNTISPDLTSLTEEIKKNLITEINSDFIKTLENKIKKNLILEFKKLNSDIINELTNQLKSEIEKELKEKLMNELLLEIKLYDSRKERLERRLSPNKNNIIAPENKISPKENNLSNNIINVEELRTTDEELIKSFLSKTSIDKNFQTISDEITNKIPSKNTNSLNISNKKHYTLTQNLTESDTANTSDIDLTLDNTELDFNTYTNENFNDDFFEIDDLAITYFNDADLKERFKTFSKEQKKALKKASKDLKELSLSSLKLTKDEFYKLKEKEVYNKCIEKFKSLKK